MNILVLVHILSDYVHVLNCTSVTRFCFYTTRCHNARSLYFFSSILLLPSIFLLTFVELYRSYRNLNFDRLDRAKVFNRSPGQTCTWSTLWRTSDAGIMRMVNLICLLQYIVNTNTSRNGKNINITTYYDLKHQSSTCTMSTGE